MISPAIFFHFFQHSDFSGFSNFINKCQKEILRCAPPSSRVCDFIHFFRILICGVVIEVKGQKIVQNYKKFCPSCSISQEPHIIWLSFMVHICKMNISGCFSCRFSKFWFSGLSGGVKGQKNAQNDKFFVCHILYFRNYISYDLHIWYTCMYKRMVSLGIFHFFKGDKRAKMAQNDKKIFLPHSVSQKPYIWLWFLVHKMMISPAIIFIFSKFWFFGFLVRG